MNAIEIVYLAVGVAADSMLLAVYFASIRERRNRAARVSILLLILFSLVWFDAYVFLALSDTILLGAVSVVGLLAAAFFLPLGSTDAIDAAHITERVDERDVVFSREEYEPGTDKYQQYYARRPEFREIDDRFRKLPELFEPGGRFYDAKRSAAMDATFDEIAALAKEVDGDVSGDRTEVDALSMTDEIKRRVLDAGATEVGVARLNPMFVYSHVGRGPQKWGAPVECRHRFAICFTLEMDYTCVETAPDLPITEETARQYLNGSRISIPLAEHIRSLGYPARAHVAGSNYQIMLPPVAHDAGLGELGRFGYLISPRLGARVRLGAVTTDLPLIADTPIKFGVQDFCKKCLKCATNCPPGAITDGVKTNLRGIEKWVLDREKCLHYWRVIGTDCGLCMKVCPFSHPSTLVHNLVRAGIKRSTIARTLSVWGDDLFYGRQDKGARSHRDQYEGTKR